MHQLLNLLQTAACLKTLTVFSDLSDCFVKVTLM